MASNREERFLMRQRGAVTHKVRNVDFGLAFPFGARPSAPAPAALPAQRSSRRTPQPLPPQRSSRRTPSAVPTPSASARSRTQSARRTTPASTRREQEISSSQRSNRKTPSQSAEQAKVPSSQRFAQGRAAQSSQETIQVPNSQPLSSQRSSRRTPGAAEQEPSSHRGGHNPPASSASARNRQSVRTLHDVPEEIAEQEPPSSRRSTRSSTQLMGSSPTTTLRAQELLAAATPTHTGKRKRSQSIPQQALPEAQDKSLSPKSAKSITVPKPGKRDVSINVSSPRATEQNEQSKPSQRSPMGAKKRERRRKSIVQHIGKKKAPKPTSQHSEEIEPEPGQAEEPEEPEEGEEPDEASQELAVQPAKDSVKGANQRQPRKSATSATEPGSSQPSQLAVTQPHATQAEQQPGKQTRGRGRPKLQPSQSLPQGRKSPRAQPPAETSTTQTTPPPKKRRRRQASAAPSEEQTTGHRRQTVNSVPITVHRLTRPRGANDAEDNGIGTYIPAGKHSGVNAIDVLSQICKELIDRSVDRIETGLENVSDDASRTDLRRRKKAVEAFGEELDARFFEMTEALDNNLSLTSRLKQANKEKLALREELLSIRRERERIALKMDSIRIKHEHESKIAEDRENLNAAIHDIELAVERGRVGASTAAPPPATTEPDSASTSANPSKEPVDRLGKNIEIDLVHLAMDVSSASPGGGLLHQVKSFNAFLENAALVLEGRATVT